MFASGNYPLGAENDPNAPWNHGTPNTERKFYCDVSYTLYKRDYVVSDQYYECSEKDEDGFYNRWTETDFDYEKEWKEQSYTPSELLCIFSDFLEEEIDKLKDKTDDISKSKLREYKDYLSACEDWTEDEVNVCGID